MNYQVKVANAEQHELIANESQKGRPSIKILGDLMQETNIYYSLKQAYKRKIRR